LQEEIEKCRLVNSYFKPQRRNRKINNWCARIRTDNLTNVRVSRTLAREATARVSRDLQQTYQDGVIGADNEGV
jgi:hypothetical protein